MDTKIIALCDDNKESLCLLEKIIKNYYESKNISITIFLYENGQDFLDKSAIRNHNLVFMDIDLGGANGIDIVNQFRILINDPIPIIFVTGYDEFKSQVLSIHTFDYIVKPYREETIMHTLNELEIWTENKSKKDSVKLPFKTIDGISYLNLDDILYLQYINRKISIITKNKPYYMYGSIKDNLKRLKHYNFFCINSACIINLEKVATITKQNTIIMEDGGELPIAQTKIKNFKKEFLDLITNSI